ncbi:MAG: glycoside hydrolase family 113, partial [Luteibaculum sp.]
MRLFLFLALGQMLFLTACTGQAQKAKINGLSFVGSQALPSDSCWQTVLYVNANTISLMPYAYGKNNETKLVSHTAWQWSGESYQGIAHCVKAGKERGLNVIIKPHLWLGWEDYTGKLQQKNEEDWKVWSEQYNAYVIQFAKLAAQNDLQYFCLANEMESYWRNYPSGFEALIDSCKKIFRGNL